MKDLLIAALIAILLPLSSVGETSPGRTVIALNGTWQFDQTEKAFPPAKFTRTIPVPGLVHLAEPKIADYDKFFQRPGKVVLKNQHNLYDIDYVPRYSWYRRSIFIPVEMQGREAMITIKKSQYVTQVYINGMDVGNSMACHTPVEFPVTGSLKYGADNEILIRVGDRVWLPSEAAGGTDKEKEHYLPGIWDDVELSFTGKSRINRMLVLPSVKNNKVTLRVQVRNFEPAQIFYGDLMADPLTLSVTLKEKISGKPVGKVTTEFTARRDNLTETSVEIDLKDFRVWTPDDPYLYTAEATLASSTGITDKLSKNFGMRDFTRKGKYFYLNGEKTILRGTNITLQRFFEDPDCSSLAWDTAWVRKFLIDIPKGLHWNAMRICVGIVPDFWYDLADEYGLMFQNEWLYWQNHGWNDQIRKEYTDWVWSDGNHPSIVIWDAINENWDEYIGNKLIPELRLLDPTRIWDTGYMTGEEITLDEMDEPHPYQGPMPWIKPEDFEKNPYPLGDLNFRPELIRKMEDAGTAQLVNEYGWIWLWRDGRPSKLTVDLYNYYLGAGSGAEENRELQAYWLQLETEWLRSNPDAAGVLAFCYLANNYGYTGDWFTGNIRDLTPSPTLDWFRHAFAPVATFINLTDQKYTKHTRPYKPGENLLFNLAGVNNLHQTVNGKVTLTLTGDSGNVALSRELNVELNPFVRTDIPVSLSLPAKPGIYLLKAEFRQGENQPAISRRYLKIQ